MPAQTVQFYLEVEIIPAVNLAPLSSTTTLLYSPYTNDGTKMIDR